MSDLDVIRELENIIGVDLYQLKKIEWDSRGYTRNKQGEITGLGLFNSGIKVLAEIIAPLKKLHQLTTLYLPSNQISDIILLKDFTKITTLDLSYNQITNLPRWVIDFDYKILWDNHAWEDENKWDDDNYYNNDYDESDSDGEESTWDDSEITWGSDDATWDVDELTLDTDEILWEDGDISSSGLNLYNNPLQTPPPEIIKQGKEALANYFAQLDAQQENYLFEAKMLILGEPGAGKTSLAWKFEDENCELPKEEDTTKGIDILEYDFPLSKEDVSLLTKKKKESRDIFRLNLWDFGGQEIYKATHRFFLSKRSLYVLVADSRKEDTDFNYWLPIVEIFGGDSPLLIVLNERFQRKRDLDISAMKARFSNIVDVLEVDLAADDKTRLKNLKTVIRHYVSRLPHIGSPVPAKWKFVREALEENKNNTVTLQDYLKICAENSIKKTQDQLVLSQYFHDIGVFLHFQDDPILKRTIFLKPNWATNTIYQILDHPLLNEQEGRFSREDANAIWADEEFTFLRDELLQLMKKFFLAYEIENSGEYIVPERLPPNTPEYSWEEKNNLVMQYNYDFFMPRGILSQFIVQMNRYIKDHHLVWKRGVILEREGARAEITESYTSTNIQIKISGKNRRDFMTIISERINAINAQYEKIKVEKLIPCNCAECKASPEPYFYEYKKLKRRLENNIREILCEKSYKKVDVRGLIDEIVNEGIRRGGLKSNMTTRKKIFVSYSHKDSFWLERVKVHLKGLRHLEIDAQPWDDTQIKSGDRWYSEIKGTLSQSHAAILLISADFLASDFIANEELPELLHSAENDGLTILPVIVKPSLFGKTELSAFQAVNDPEKPLSALSESEQEAVLVLLAKRVAELV